MTACDMDMDGSLTSGIAATNLHGAKSDQPIGIGGTSKDMHIEDSEVQRLSSTLVIGSTLSGSITVDGAVFASVFLIATGPGAQADFSGASSTFNNAAAQADNGIFVTTDLTTTASSLYLNGDTDSTVDGADTVSFTDTKTITSAATLTLQATLGLNVAGRLTLMAGTGIVILNDMTSSGSAKRIVMNSDFESPGDGTITVSTGMTIESNNNNVFITAWDVALDGTIDSGTAVTHIHGAKINQTIGLGAASNDMHVAVSELARIPGGLVVGSSASGAITVNGVDRDSLTLVATRDDAFITFSGASSTFMSFVAQADNGVVISADVTTTTGSMYLDGDSDSSGTSDGINTINFTDGRTLTAKVVLTLEATTAVLFHQGSLTLSAGEGIMLLNSLSGGTPGSPLVLSADYETAGDGTLTLTIGKVITTQQ